MYRMYTLFCLAAALAAFVPAAQATECAAAGFTEGLLCSACEALEKHDLAELVADCKRCCEEDGLGKSGKAEKYAKAVLEMCRCKLNAFPQIAPFEDKGKRAKDFKNFEFQHAHLAPPRLKMYNAKGKVEEVLNIEAWSTDTVAAYLTEKLDQGEAKAKAKSKGKKKSKKASKK